MVENAAASPVVAKIAAATPEVHISTAVSPEALFSTSPCPRKCRKRRAPVAPPIPVALKDLTPERPSVAVPELQNAVVPDISSAVVHGDLTLGVRSPVVQEGDTLVVPELPVTNSEVVFVSSAIFAFYVMAVLHAKIMQTSMLAASDPETVYYPEPAACLEASLDLPVLPDTAMEAVTEQSVLPQ
ncbi:hypothetical protein ROHU_029973 [Labeo rohita]|uniref:Uncharacterized protein n=1 Tax=Labeo rohita TaxID=84645 RepID=A0A498LWJ0_LABRO|nr:hypothetical protein ROHU_029973 [Labeo rohita]